MASLLSSKSSTRLILRKDVDPPFGNVYGKRVISILRLSVSSTLLTLKHPFPIYAVDELV